MSSSKDHLRQNLIHPDFPPIDYSKLSERDKVEILLRMYEFYSETTNQTSNRRLEANKFFLKLTTVGAAALGAVYFYVQKNPLQVPFVILGAAIGTLMCYVWWRMLYHYWIVNKSKFDVIGELEKRLPAAPLVGAEGHLLERWRFRSITAVEMLVPIAMLCFYLLIIVLVAYSYSNDMHAAWRHVVDFVAKR